MLLHIWLRIKLLKDDLVMVVIMLAMALVLTIIFGQAFGGDYSTPISVVDLDNTEKSETFIERIYEIPGYDFSVNSQQDMESLVKDSTVLAAVVLEAGFSEDMTNIKIVTGKSAVEVMQLKQSLLQAINETSNKDSLSYAIAKTLNIEEDISGEVRDDFDEKYSDKAFEIVTASKGESTWTGYNDLMHYVLGFMLFFSTFSMILVMADILKEKKIHVFQRNLVTPVSKFSQLFAKMFVTFLLGFAQITIILLCGQYLFGIDWGGTLWILLLISGCYILTFTCLGLFLSSVIKSYDQLGAMSPIILVSTAMLGGCMWPLEIITSKVLLFAGNLTPQKWALSAMEDVAMHGAGLSSAMPAVLVLLGMSLVYFLLGLGVMKKDLV